MSHPIQRLLHAMIPLIFIFSIADSACTGSPERLNMGLRSFTLLLSEESSTQLRQGGAEKTFVSARLRLDPAHGEREKVWNGAVSLAGEGTLDALKKSYNFQSTDGSLALRLSAQTQDRSFLRTLLGARVYRELGLLTPTVEPVTLYLNEDLAGLYLAIERVDERFYERRSIRPERIYQSRVTRSTFRPSMIVDPESGFEIKFGKFHPAEISRMAAWANSPSTDDQLRFLEQLADIPNFLAYFTSNLFLANCDGFKNNIFLYKEFGQTQLRFTPWDWERVYEGGCNFEGLFPQNRLLSKAMEYPLLSVQIVDRLDEYRTRLFPAEWVQNVVNEDFQLLVRSYQEDRLLGGFGLDPNTERDRLLEIHQGTLKSIDRFITQERQRALSRSPQ
jgi:hypothetical protein